MNGNWYVLRRLSIFRCAAVIARGEAKRRFLLYKYGTPFESPFSHSLLFIWLLPRGLSFLLPLVLSTSSASSFLCHGSGEEEAVVC